MEETMIDISSLDESRIKDSIRGCLMAGAAGDALGYPVEFISRDAILSEFGEPGITEFQLGSNDKAQVSDDTQMTLFTANGMLTGLTQGCEQPEVYVREAYLDWYYTQTGLRRDEKGCTWLRDLPELAHRRAPGITCMNACEHILNHQEPVNNSKGCGGIMRVAPVGLLDAAFLLRNGKGLYSREQLANAGAFVAKITHLHPLGYLPSALLALLIARVTPLTADQVKASITDFIREDLETMMGIEGEEHTEDKQFLKNLTLKAMELAQSDISDADAIRALGEGWVGEEAWAISLYCVLRHIDSVRDAIVAAVNHDGDSDSTGAITGNIMGAIYGYEAIRRNRLFCPEGRSFEDTLELHNIILALADDLYTGRIITEHDPIDTPEKQQWFARYCEMHPAGL